ncbi:MAG: hypothetical protein AAF789_13675, partial [Bacteroidota bacterium]
MNKLKYLVYLIIFGFCVNLAKAQEEVILDEKQFTLSFFPIIAHGEFKLGSKQSLTVGGGLFYGAYLQVVNDEASLDFFQSPFLTSSLRNYYNRKRVNKSDLRNNSGNYFGLLSTYSFRSVVFAEDLFGD